MAGPVIRQATPEDGPTVVTTLVEALVEDPVFRWIFSSDPDGVETGLRAWMTLVVDRTRDRAETWLTDDGSAAVIWITPDAPLIPDDYAAIGALLAERIGDRAGPVLSAIGAASAGVPDTPHRTLLYVGVRRGAQGRGLGSRVVAPGLLAADAAGLPIHCNSTNPRNGSFYERLGFQPLAAPVVTGAAPPISPLWRPRRG